MKKISVVLVTGILLLVTVFKTQAQANRNWQTTAINPYHLSIAYSKTSNIIFPYAIVSVDIGSKDVLVQKAKGVENILQIKAAKNNFTQTNISIVTADGKFTSFIVDFSEQPSVLNLSLIDSGDQHTSCIFSESVNREQMEHYASMAIHSKKIIRGVKDKSFGIGIKLNGLFIHDGLMLLRFYITNETDINYDIDQFRLFIRDQKKVKRTATQEIEISPLFVYNNTNKITGQSENTIVFVVKKFTIPDKKYLSVQLMEKNGGRHMELYVKNKKIIKAVWID
ncbi:MAG TPA: conjugative transposon protein TraN [Hanamia sp.]|nr:conjugative transposon protein TraN [Hanamia sp.]